MIIDNLTIAGLFVAIVVFTAVLIISNLQHASQK